jgi:ABC-2 type transport system permease protein
MGLLGVPRGAAATRPGLVAPMSGMTAMTGLREYLLAFRAIAQREIVKFLHQTERLIAALVRPGLWLLVFAAGLHDLLGVSIIPPYETYTPYGEYILPGLIGIVVLFQCMQSALSMVYDREAGVMRVMLVTPVPRPFLLFAKTAAATLLALLQVYAFLIVAALFGDSMPPWSWLSIIPAVIMVGLMLGSVGLLVSVYTRRIENFAGMMNFVVFPMFFLSSALYPLWKLREAGAWPVYYLSMVNPFTYAVELVRFSAYGQFNATALAVVAGVGLLAFGLAAYGYTPRPHRAAPGG